MADLTPIPMGIQWDPWDPSLPHSYAHLYYNVDIGASAKLELVDKFCYLGDMLSVDGDADAAMEARIRIGWNKFKQLVPLLTNKDVIFDYERKVV